MNNTCPGCGAAYTITSQHVGRSITCKKCGAALVVQADGLRLAASASPVPEPAAVFGAEPEELSPARRRRSRSFGDRMSGVRAALRAMADVPTWLFAVGALFVIVFLFFPLIDQAKVARRQAAIAEGELRQSRLDRELAEKKDATDKDRENRKKEREEWETDKAKLEERVGDARLTSMFAGYWYDWGMMIGFLFLAAGSLGYLSPNQPLIRRITGCIVLSGQLLVIFLMFTTTSVITSTALKFLGQTGKGP